MICQGQPTTFFRQNNCSKQQLLSCNRSILISSSKISKIGFSGFLPNSCSDDFWKLSFSHITTKLLTLQLIKQSFKISV